MKSHPEAGTRPAAEVVTQLPVPSHLGMLRFERLNEPNWALLYLDPACEQSLGVCASDLCSLLDSPYACLMEPEARYTLHQHIQQQLEQGPHYSVRYTLHTPLGPLSLLEIGEPYNQRSRQLLRGYLIATPHNSAAPNPATLNLERENWPLPQQIQVETAPQALNSHALHLFEQAVQHSASAFLLLTHDGRLQYVNPSFTTITQYSSAEVCGQRLAELPALAELAQVLEYATLSEHNSWQGELRSRRKNQEPYWGQLSISKVYDDHGALTHYIGVYEDITLCKQAHQQVERLAFTDDLTSLGNRPAFIRSLEERFASSACTPFWILLVDIDNFKRINDSLGHKSGDKLLTSLARRLRSTLGRDCILARFASNEFAILVDAFTPETGPSMAKLVLQTVDKPLFVDNQLINISASLGLAVAPEHGRDPQTLLKHAGLALHKAKANGKRQIQVFTEAFHAEAHHKLFVENNLRRALTQNELEVFYQPKLCLKSGQITGLEALLRWNHPQQGMIRPDQFISVAEDTGLIIPIGKWVIRQACRMTQQVAAIGLGELQMAINLSPKQFCDPDLVSSIADILREEQLPPYLLELELTESLLLEATDDTRNKLLQLKALGLTLAMDDFGTGYSSLSYLKKFPIDVIKIDRSFVKDIPDNQGDMEITSAVIAMAHNLKLEVVAEGIETAAQLNFLRKQKCDVGQGYLFDQPIAGRGLIEALRRYPCRPKA